MSEISKSFGGRTLFTDVALQVNRGDRVGLVGPNGAGKSTLFNLILGFAEPDSGVISFQRGHTTGFLPQETLPPGGESVLQLAIALPAAIGRGGEGTGSSDHHEDYSHLAHPAGVQSESKAKRMLAGLGFKNKDFDRPARELSGGWVMRAHLARLLTYEPDLLLLDEPTNHLDLEALLWFQDYLKQYPGAVLMISHDREFLNQLAGSIVEIRQSRLMRYRGNYEDYLNQRAAQAEQQMAAYKNQQREIGRLMEFVERFRAKNTKAAQAQSKLKQIDRMEKVAAPESDDKSIDFNFPQPQRSGLKVITLTDVHHSYGNNVVYAGMNFRAERGQRIVLVGPNGAGKSTLLKILAGVIPFQGGKRELGHNVKAAYYSQYRVEMLRPELTVLEEALDTPQRVTEQFVRTLLGCFLFHDDDVFKRVSVLSGGEKSRLALVKILLDPPNLLLMDEPTTHLDMASIEALIEALSQYAGTLIFISHDVFFIRSLANHVVHVNAGRLTHYGGGYQYYLDKIAASLALSVLNSAPARSPEPEEKSGVKAREQKRQEAEARQARSRSRKEQQRVVAGLETEIAELEARQVELTAELEKPETYAEPGRAMKINRELLHAQERLAELNPAWEEAAAKLEAIG